MVEKKFVLTRVWNREIYNRFYVTFKEAWDVMNKELLEIPTVKNVAEIHPEYLDTDGNFIADVTEKEDDFHVYEDTAWAYDSWDIYDWKIDEIGAENKLDYDYNIP